MIFPTRHQLLRDRRDWLGTSSGLAIDRDGDLLLARIPAPANGKAIDITTSYPYPREVSGLALGACGAVFVADTSHNRVLFVDGLCDSESWLPAIGGASSDAPGHFHTPRGLALSDDALLVADTGNARLQSLALPRLEANRVWLQWTQPTSLCIDSKQRVVIVDAASLSVHRLQANGTVDVAFDSTIASQSKLQQPLFVACGAEDCVLVSDQQANAVFVFDAAGVFVAELSGPSGWQPGALVSSGARIFVADAASGAICVFEWTTPNAQLIGQVNGWRGPVTALAVDENGDLFIKPALDATYYHFTADQAYVTQGELIAGPFDAGEEREWERTWIDAQTPALAATTIAVALKNTSAAPLPTDWLSCPASDVLLSQLGFTERRYIWLRVEFATRSPQQSPRLRQARAATAVEDLRDYLPLTYRRQDADGEGFLSRWMKLIQGEFGAIEALLDDMPRVGDTQFAPASTLLWLAQWLSLELPVIANDDERRTLLARAVQLYARRGTKASIAEFVELHTGIKPTLIEAFNDRRIWVLGASSRLDFDTRLPDLDPLGMVLADESAGGGCCPTSAGNDSPCSPCAPPATNTTAVAVATPIGRAVVGEGGPLASYQIGLPLFSQEAYRFCVVIDGYRARDPATRQEIARIVEREKPAHTDYRIEYVDPDMRIGMQARIGIDAIVGGDPPPLRLSATQLDVDTQLPPSDVARVGVAALDGMLTLT